MPSLTNEHDSKLVVYSAAILLILIQVEYAIKCRKEATDNEKAKKASEQLILSVRNACGGD